MTDPVSPSHHFPFSISSLDIHPVFINILCCLHLLWISKVIICIVGFLLPISNTVLTFLSPVYQSTFFPSIFSVSEFIVLFITFSSLQVEFWIDSRLFYTPIISEFDLFSMYVPNPEADASLKTTHPETLFLWVSMLLSFRSWQFSYQNMASCKSL